MFLELHRHISKHDQTRLGARLVRVRIEAETCGSGRWAQLLPKAPSVPAAPSLQTGDSVVRLLPRPGYESGTVYSLPWCGYVSTTVGRALLILPKIRLAEIRLWEA